MSAAELDGWIEAVRQLTNPKSPKTGRGVSDSETRHIVSKRRRKTR